MVTFQQFGTPIHMKLHQDWCQHLGLWSTECNHDSRGHCIVTFENWFSFFWKKTVKNCTGRANPYLDHLINIWLTPSCKNGFAPGEVWTKVSLLEDYHCGQCSGLNYSNLKRLNHLDHYSCMGLLVSPVDIWVIGFGSCVVVAGHYYCLAHLGRQCVCWCGCCWACTLCCLEAVEADPPMGE